MAMHSDVFQYAVGRISNETLPPDSPHFSHVHTLHESSASSSGSLVLSPLLMSVHLTKITTSQPILCKSRLP
jgi:hypothetical protein